jgi:hypothetical protein
MPNEQHRFPLSTVLVNELEVIKELGASELPPLLPDADDKRREEIERKRLRWIYDAAYKCSLSALCLSGGGIRSAAFSLGVIQALADKGLLQKFDYLSTVSGGGYIGAWLSARLHHTRDANNVVDAKQVMKELHSRRMDSDSEAQPIKHLREYSSYLTPKVGLLSADTWAALAIILRNMGLNWLILVPLICLPVILVKVVAAIVHTGRFGYAPWGSAAAAAVCCLLLVLSIGYQLCRLYVSREISPSAATEQKRFLWLSVLPAAIVGGGVAWLANQLLEHQGLTLADALLAPTNASSNWHEWQVMAALGFSFCGIIALAASALALLRKPQSNSPCFRVRDIGWAWAVIGLLWGSVMWIGVLLAPTNASSIWDEWQSMAALGFTLCGIIALVTVSALALFGGSQPNSPRPRVKDVGSIILAWAVVGLLWGLVMWVGALLTPNVPSIWHGWGSMAALGIFLYGLTALVASAVARQSEPQGKWPRLCVKDASRNILAWAVTGLLWGQ